MKFKKILLILLPFIILTCSKNIIIDIEEPQLENLFQNGDNLFLQFNEPVKTLKIYHENTNEVISNIFPVANNIVRLPENSNKQKIVLSIEAIDTSGNRMFIQDKSISINTNPAVLSISSLNIKYTKKKKQKMLLRTDKAGYLNGFSILVFQGKKMKKISFSDEFINSQFLELFIDTNPSSSELSAETNTISLSRNQILLKNRLSKIYGLIIVENNNEEIDDYFLYYNLKEHDNNYFENNKNFNYLKKYLSSNNIENPVIHDISKS